MYVYNGWWMWRGAAVIIIIDDDDDDGDFVVGGVAFICQFMNESNFVINAMVVGLHHQSWLIGSCETHGSVVQHRPNKVLCDEGGGGGFVYTYIEMYYV